MLARLARSVAVSATLFAVVALLFAPRVASAHQVGLSRGTYTADASGVHVDITFARADAASLALSKSTDPSALVALDSCTGRIASLEPTAADGLEMRADYTCPAGTRAVDVRLIEALGGGHRHLAHTPSGDLVLKEGEARFEMGAAVRAPALGKLVAMGITHILSGWDHLLFLLGLLLLAPRPKSLAFMISAFTIAHSITLGLSAFGVWAPPPSIVEPAIALSIAWVGIENLRSKKNTAKWHITFLFGLVHGFGFAGALRELGTSRASAPKILLGFNLGVEIGQLAVVIPLALALAWLARHKALPARTVSLASAVIIVIGLALFVARVA